MTSGPAHELHRTIERAGAASGLVTMALFGAFFWLTAGYVPPLAPDESAAQTARRIAEHDLRIRVGLGALVLVAPLFCPFIAAIARQVRRIEGYWGVLSLTQIVAGVVFPIGFMFPTMVSIAAAYRTDRDPETTQALNDVFWLIFVGIVGTLVLQSAVLATATFIDRRAEPVFPRWFGYLNIWYAIMATPGCAIMLFHRGPLAWNGAFAFWIPLVAFTAWMVAVSVVLWRAVGREADADTLAIPDVRIDTAVGAGTER